jgi:hypothetical protein
MALTIGGLISEARTVLQDVDAVRYSDDDMVRYFNDALLQARAKRPDAFLDMGMRAPVPQYAMPGDQDTTFPLDPGYWPAFLFYVAGFCELREDTFADDKRATVLVNKFVSQLLQVAS